MKFNLSTLFLLILMALIAGSGGAWAQAQEEELTEELFFRPIETVITAGRTEQSIERAPSTVTVISSEEIKASGAQTIPDLLRLVPGLDVMTISSSHAEVNARGLNQVLSNKLLVLIDGRSVYFDFFGGVIWQGLPIMIEQIDRVEVVRSPSSALYGANAFSGVVNILTKTPRQLRGSHLSVQGGELSNLYGSFQFGSRKGETGYRLGLGTRQINSLENRRKDSEQVALANMMVEHRFENDARLSVEGGLSKGSIVQIVRIDDNEFDATTSYAKLNLDHQGLKLQAFWNRGDETGDPFFVNSENVDILYNTFDLDLQNMFALGRRNSFICGATYRYNTFESNVIDRDHQQHLLAGYFQDEYSPLPELSLLAGARVDHHPQVGTNYSPRGSLIWSPIARHTFRASVGRAFRNPSFTDSYFQLRTSDRIDEGILILGQTDLEAEKITTYELGYTYFPDPRFRAEANLFAYRFSDYIGPDSVRLVEGMPVQSFRNLGRASAHGFELTGDLLPAPWLKVSANYSYQTLGNQYTVLRIQEPTTHKLNLKLFLSLPRGMSASLLASHRGETVWETPTLDGRYYERSVSGPHTRCDARMAWLLERSRLELFVVAYNLFDRRYLEYPLADRYRRRMVGGFNLSF